MLRDIGPGSTLALWLARSHWRSPSPSGDVRMLERAPAGRFNNQPTYVYAYARHSVADCPQGQFCDPAPPRSCGAPRDVAENDVHAAPALHATLYRARRVALKRAGSPRTAGIRAVSIRSTAPFTFKRLRPQLFRTA